MKPTLPPGTAPAQETRRAAKPASTGAAVAAPAPRTGAHDATAHPWHDDFQHIACPFCHSGATRVISLFGGNAGEILMQCRACSTAFHWIKWQGKLPPHPGQ